ncbi:hypothetical protein BU14_0068s0033 [Porphyra umbilicalis]|uniref:Uncharacterized protein n=1 Tax=Porphyra umbilicalis TaxID=2786 RepID=A0A1X6PGL8_PORUM|nr:hypothetical protein BU14_0068s0033 [Porphyra umbilicalis]|eukprot:OSX79938.1 hypothetical protein BU14_0068s0033 [Porphyra umbilicalis]
MLLGAARRCPPPAAQRRAPRGAVVPPAVPSQPFLPVPGVLLLGVERRCPPPCCSLASRSPLRGGASHAALLSRPSSFLTCKSP